MKDYVFEKKTKEELKKILDEVVESILANGFLSINKIIMYGSYARDEAHNDSDIDIMVLCDDDQKDADRHASDIFRCADRVAFDNDVIIQTNVKNKDFFKSRGKIKR